MDSNLLVAARGGDTASFDALVAPFRRELTAHCYRLTGSLSDADDLLQESLLRAWKGLGGFEGKASLRSWLYRIATNTCLTEIERRPRRAMPSDFGPPADLAAGPSVPVMDPIWLDPCPDAMWMEATPAPDATISARESVAIAFVAAIQTLPALQRAVLIFRDVLGWSAAEVAESLETSVPAVNSALQRARDTLEKRREQGIDALAPLDGKLQALLVRYVQAWESGDVDTLASLLREDATLSMPPMPAWYAGRHVIEPFLRGLVPMLGKLRLVPVGISGGPGVALYRQLPGDTAFRAFGLQALRIDAEGRIASIDTFTGPQHFGTFGLPGEVA